MPITDRQKKELNIAILEYLRDHGYDNTLKSFLDESKEEIPDKNIKTLERKWNAVIRLTTKLQKTESKLFEMENELKEAKPFNFNSFKGPKKIFKELLPNKQKFHIKGHKKAINRVLFHPNYSWLVTASDDSQIGVWDYETGKHEKWLRGHTNFVLDIAFNKQGTYLASSSVDMSIKIWNFDDEFRCYKTLNGHDHTVSGVVFCIHDENLLLSCSRDGTVKVWDLSSGYCSKTLEGLHDGEWIKKIIISYDGSLMGTCSVDQTVRVFNIMNDYKEIGVYRGHEHVVEDIIFSNPNTDDIILEKEKKINDDDDDSDNEQEAEQKPPRFIASASRDKMIIIWDIKTETNIMKLVGHENWVRSLVFHPCGRYLISSADDKSIRCWDLSKRRLYSKIDQCHNGFISSIDWHNSESLLASGAASKDIKIWEYDKKYEEKNGQ